jgi:NhaP-type Na+/H+ or K+/H+ antiporter
LDRKTQFILFLAGIRGAVSFALVSNIPVFDVVTEKGTRYKAELKAMTSTAIIFTLFAFGALTFFSIDRDNTTVVIEVTTTSTGNNGPPSTSQEDAKLLPQKNDTLSTKQYGATRTDDDDDERGH